MQTLDTVKKFIYYLFVYYYLKYNTMKYLILVLKIKIMYYIYKYNSIHS